MDYPPPPNERLATLVSVLGDADTRELVEIFLDSFSALLRDLGSSDPAVAERAAHSLKSSARQMGLSDLSERMAALEERLRYPGATVSPPELISIADELEQSAKPLQAYLKG
jgi:HPt (histidine-containing phosphotransfer) domain-containing protein